MRRIKLKFHNNGTKCSVFFSRGKESDIYKSKLSILFYITDLVFKKEISFISFSIKVGRILKAKNLPLYEPEEPEEKLPEKPFDEVSAFLELKSFIK